MNGTCPNSGSTKYQGYEKRSYLFTGFCKKGSLDHLTMLFGSEIQDKNRIGKTSSQLRKLAYRNPIRAGIDKGFLRSSEGLSARSGGTTPCLKRSGGGGPKNGHTQLGELAKKSYASVVISHAIQNNGAERRIRSKNEKKKTERKTRKSR